MGFFEFEWSVLKRAARDFWKAIQENFFNRAYGAIITIATLFLGYLFGVAVVDSVALQIVAAALAPIAALIIAFFYYWARAGWELNKEQVEKIGALETRVAEFTREPLRIVLQTRAGQRLTDGTPVEWFCAGVRNDGDRTLQDVTLRAQASEFTENAIAQLYPREVDMIGNPFRVDREPIILTLTDLHPGATEFDEIFGDPRTGPPVFDTVYRFTLEARARDTRTVTAEFEYDPNQTPRIQRVPR